MPDEPTTTATDPTTGEDVELPSDDFDHGDAHPDQSADPLPGSPA